MEIASLADIANIIAFIAPGYVTIQVYSLAYAKKDREFSRLFIESIIYSLPIVAFSNLLWGFLFQQTPTSSLDIRYISFILFISLLIGLATTYLRTHWPIKDLAKSLGLGSPNEDFVKAQFARIDTKNPKKSAVTVQLKNGSVFSATVDRISRYNHGGPMYYCFANLAWFSEATGDWDEREGGIIIERSEIEFIETTKLSDKL